MVWKEIQVHDVMQRAGFCAVGCRKNSAGKISLLGHYPGNQPTKDPNHPFPILNHHN
jgi:hypothetical protein